MIGNIRQQWAERSPFTWILATPLVTLPLSGLLLFTVGGTVDAEALGLTEQEWVKVGERLDRVNYFHFDFWSTCGLLLGPGLLNLVVALWVFHPLTYVRTASLLALLLALLRTFVVPLAAILLSPTDLLSSEGLIIRVPIEESGLRSDPSSELAIFRLLGVAWAGGLAMWIVTAVAWKAYEPLMARFQPHLTPPRERHTGEPSKWGGFLSRR
ncbi:MAG TPA: hypothetical protein DGL25_06065 [Dehalococcoidia bacterium]|nr:hypothetical protein [Dehalococcoidia bacterium]